jgi:hypothetical protein
MNNSILYNIAGNINFEQLPVLWKDIDFNKFSEHKSLYPYHREALQNATKIIYKFYDNFSDTEISKKRFLKLNEQNGLSKDLQKRHFTYSDTESTAYEILSEYFEEEDYKLPAWNFIGTHKDAKKFILQSIGRGIRIEPIHSQRERKR